MPTLTRKCRGVYRVVALVLAGGVHVLTQSRLDVVSVRENPSDGPNYTADIAFRPGRLQITNETLEDLIAYGYSIKAAALRSTLIVGWPHTGIQQKRFDIQAILTTSDTLSAEQRRRVVLDVLETRFNFKAHRERRLLNGYLAALVKPGTLGRALKRVDFNCAEIDAGEAPQDESGRSLCRRGLEYRARTATPFFHGSGSSDVLALDLELATRHPVANETELTGFFVWDIDYGPRLPGADRLEVAIREQLGIKLMPNRVPTDVVVIDDVRMPTPN